MFFNISADTLEANFNNYLNTVFKHSLFLKNFYNKNKLDNKSIINNLLKQRSVKEILENFKSVDYLNLDEKEFLSFIRKMKYQEYLIIAIKDLCLSCPIKDLTAHISSFAKAAVEVAYEYALNQLKREYGNPLDENGDEIGFCIIALGKFGGWELNFSSDIDIIYVYETEKGECSKSKISVHEFFCKLGEKIKYLLNERTEDGIVYRVDLRLRPDGDIGDIALPLRSYEIYYETYGQSWERMMLLKALPVAGNAELGLKFLESVKPFVFRRSIDTRLIDDLINIKSKINSRVKLKKQDKNVKLGYGGIREIEFVVQSTQILYYPKDNDIFNRNTLTSLEIFKEKKVFPDKDIDDLIISYNFLRKLEHMAQIELEQQTHIVPEKSENYQNYLERCGFKNKDEFEKKYSEITSRVNSIFENILKSESSDSDDLFLFDEELQLSDMAAILKGLNINKPQECAEILDNIIKGKGRKKRFAKDRELLKKILSLLVKELPDIKDPVETLKNFERFFSVTTSIYLFYDIFSESGTFLKKLVNIFSLSPYLSNTIIRNNNVLDYIYDPKPYTYNHHELCNQLFQIAENAGNIEYEYELIRRAHQELVFNLGYAYINKDVNVIQLTTNLTNLAKACICLALRREFDILKEKYGNPAINDKFCDFLVIGMGKLGSYEMSFGSDLDIIVLYEDKGYTDGKISITNQEFYSKLIQRAISYLSTQTVFGYLYKIDMRLRPSGSSGTLVTTLDSFREYQKNKAMLWEKQALIRASIINEDSAISNTFKQIKNETLYSGSITSEQIEEIYDMRLRIEREKGSPVTKNDIKSGYGGLIDIEFSVQMLLLKYGYTFPQIRKTNTHSALHELKKAELIKSRDFYALHNSYLFFRNLENLIRVYKNSSSSVLPKDDETLEKLSTFFGYKQNGAEKLMNEYLTARKSVRAAFNRLFSK
ncbi:bifunctional [glutamate--ammonia ligase]-adenylyl-L-tyrosine phosphorylase/[glutamate--ammonia-ligase] adenylyltransferase [Deferribacterales bacterium Es71-Z0220]|jgi:glutamate-ammonia-ligase adenylyltransferase|uniref:bifunctional [glutamate--ammonia ligase]-adenylyl-L-tyrosine phosphorylase/[glutamate--ammonia-ligase] adenylyltransferase n=1 Tax=Deferrivibrio essentukiensis TaxID=2880922 RepID=UPI001F60BEFE|nr:bifunctional [glutamate--ammonia ligase]-adenylyl-L-tyrosine phosphorylase/[glutamate--ammonia-ligase] adenylyltransferase [Deferrivibrio essentukiensis]MBZ4672427.1 glnE [Deferribacteraceae bacterium]MCB4205144.1 bifunctional [glutamate--ammonia ligase]-adenylyl-L-tyrosine phosphorylase/[glutamate--ammonia-ligase] adenylyltransferase [Deferrivibrio essentukiensis]